MLINKNNYHDQMGILYPSEYPEAHVRDITFQVTEDCNLCCTYCYQTHKTKNAMSFETAKKFIDLIFDNRENPEAYYNIYNMSGFVMNFIGGEPLLEIDLIDQIIEYVESRILALEDDLWLYTHCYNFSTNGTLYFTPKVEAFRKKWGPLVSLGVTVDGNRSLHDSCRLFPDGSGSYDLASRASWEEFIRGYESSKITISPDNVSHFSEGIKHFVNIGHRFVEANCVFEDVWTKDSVIQLYHELIDLSDWITENNLYDKIYLAILDPTSFEKAPESFKYSNWCGVGQGGMSSVDHTGNIYPCVRFMPSSIGHDKKPIYIGNVENGFLSEKNHIDNCEVLNSCTRATMEPKECEDCPINRGCSWCTGFVYQHCGNFSQKTIFHCETHKVRALAVKYLTKINNDKETFDKIKINYDMYKDLISEEDFYNICEWEEEK